MKRRWLRFWMLVMLGWAYACNSSSGRGGASAGKDDLSASIARLQQAVRSSPDSAGLRFLLMDQLLQNNQLQEALTENDTLLQMDGSNAGVWYKRGVILLQNGDTVSGVAALKNALKDAPVFGEALLELAAVYASESKPEALTTADRVIQTTEDIRMASNARFIKGLYYSNVNDKAAALEQFSECIKNDYTFLDAYIEKGLLLYDQQKYTEALQVFEQAIQVSNTFAEAYYQAGRCQEALGNREEAELNYRKALGLDNHFSAAKEALEKLR